MKPEQMTAHVVEIRACSRIRIRWIKGYRARALGEFFEIESPAQIEAHFERFSSAALLSGLPRCWGMGQLHGKSSERTGASATHTNLLKRVGVPQLIADGDWRVQHDRTWDCP
jgi:hypothetical protein